MFNDVHGHLGKMMDVFEFSFTGSGNFFFGFLLSNLNHLHIDLVLQV